MTARAHWCLVAAATALFAAGVALSHRVEPNIRVEAVTLAGDTPALQFSPEDPNPHPVALLAHGVTASKETLFRLGEALASAGFTCVAVDLPGHGESTRAFSVVSHDENARPLGEVANSLKSVDVFIGHSMGSYAGAEAVREGRLKPRLFIAVGASPDLGTQGPPLLLLAGEFEEAVSLAWLKARTDARLILFPWCEHALEPVDPRLVNAAVEAACAAVGRTPPAAPTRWRWRLAGMVLGTLGAVGLAILFPGFSPRWAWARGPLLAAVAIAAVVLTTGTWVGAAPHWRRAPAQIGAAVIAWFVMWGAGKFRLPRWSFPAFAATVALAGVVVGAYFLTLLATLGALVLLAGTVLGQIAARRGSRRDGDIAMAMFVGYAIGQCVPLPLSSFLTILPHLLR